MKSLKEPKSALCKWFFSFFVACFALLLEANSFADPKPFTSYGLKVSENFESDFSAFYSSSSRTTIFQVSKWARDLSYQDFIDKLHIELPVLFESPVLMHDSGSLQGASKGAPRVVLFGDGFVFTFREPVLPATSAIESRLKQFRSVEVMVFDEKKSAFRFASYQFDLTQDQGVVNTKGCPACHGKALHPLWEPYDFWPQAFGSATARLHTDSEKAAYQGVLKEKPSNGIYAHLNLDDSPDNFLESLEAYSQYIAQLNNFRIAMQLKKMGSSYRPLRFAVMGVLNRCTLDTTSISQESLESELAAFFPVAFWQKMQTLGLNHYIKETAEQRFDFKEALDFRYMQQFPSASVIFPINHERLSNEVSKVAQLRFVFESFGLNWSQFTMSQGQNRSFLTAPSEFSADLLTALVSQFPEDFQELKPEKSGFLGLPWFIFDCASLKEKSLSTIAAAVESEAFSPKSFRKMPSKTTMGQCIACHTGPKRQVSTPAIPFNQADKLALWLNQESELGEQNLSVVKQRMVSQGPLKMPPQEKLTDEEIKALVQTFETISALANQAGQ